MKGKQILVDLLSEGHADACNKVCSPHSTSMSIDILARKQNGACGDSTEITNMGEQVTKAPAGLDAVKGWCSKACAPPCLMVSMEQATLNSDEKGKDAGERFSSERGMR